MATKSIGATGRDYATLALWAAYVNALSLSAPEVGEMYNDAEFVTAAGVTIGGWSGGSGTNTVTLRAAAGQSFRDHTDKLTNALRYNQANGVGIRCTADYVDVVTVTSTFFRMDGLQIYVDAGSGQCAVYEISADNIYTNNIFQSNSGRINAVVVGQDITVTNCLILVRGASASGINPVRISSQCFLTDLTIFSSNSSSGTGINVSYTPGPVTKNCVSYGFATDYSGTADASSSNNATDKGSFGGTNFGGSGQTSIVGATEWESVTLNSEDLRLKSTSAKLKDNGVTTGPTNDIVGTTRPKDGAYDIGCWEFDAGGSIGIFGGTGTFAATGASTAESIGSIFGIGAFTSRPVVYLMPPTSDFTDGLWTPTSGPAAGPSLRSQSNTTYASRTDTTITAPAGIVDGDILIALFHCGRSGATPFAPTPPAGWAAFGTNTNIVDGASFQGSAYIFWKRASGESGNYTFTHSTQSTQGWMGAFSGCIAAGTPLGATANATGTGATAIGSSITTTAANSWLLYFGIDWDSPGFTTTPPTGMTEDFDGAIYLAHEIITAARATGTRITTLNAGVGSVPWAVRMVELLPENPLYTAIDETTANDSDYIQSSLGPLGDKCRVKLDSPTNTPTGVMQVSYRFCKSVISEKVLTLTVRLFQGSTQITSWTDIVTSTSFTTSVQSLTSTELSNISDFTDLYLEFEANV